MEGLMKRVGYHFQTPLLLSQALTHPSGVSSGQGVSFERLEFLGDRVLGLVISHWLFEEFPQEKEGDLAKRLAALVCKETLIEVAINLDLEHAMIMKRERSSAQQKRLDTLLADGCEALIGALYLDGGIEEACAFIRRQWKDHIHRSETPPRDPKSILQEWAQSHGNPHPTYTVVHTHGPAHAPHFVVSVHVQGYEPAQGEGSSKQLAEKAAAQQLLENLV